MSRYIKSSTDTQKLNKTLKDLQKEFSYHKSAVDRNNKELSKINERIDDQRAKEIQELTAKVEKLQNETQWVKNSEPALKIDSDTMLKKLDIF